MGNKGTHQLDLKDVRREVARDPKVRIRFLRASDNRVISKRRTFRFPPSPKVVLPAFPQEKTLYCELEPSRFRFTIAPFFSLRNGETITQELTLLRIPAKWNARFDKWSKLPAPFKPLKRVLEHSPQVRVKKGPLLGKLVRGTYDNIGNQKIALAKTSLLNLYAKLSQMEVPAAGGRNWFSFVKEILVIDRERFVAIVDPQMGSIVRRIKSDIGKFKDYKHTPAANHHKNMPRKYSVAKSKMFSIKSREEDGNIQLTLGSGSEPDTGKPVLLLDADIDESGDLLGHLADVIRHKITGKGTHPFDIHEFLALAYPQVHLGYEVV